MDTAQSLAVFLCLLSASLAFPAGLKPLGMAAGKMARGFRPIPLLRPAPRFAPGAVSVPNGPWAMAPRPDNRVVNPAPAPAVQAPQPIRSVVPQPRASVKTVLSQPNSGFSMAGAGDRAMVMGSEGVPGTAFAAAPTPLRSNVPAGVNYIDGDVSISDSTVGSFQQLAAAGPGSVVVQGNGGAFPTVMSGDVPMGDSSNILAVSAPSSPPAVALGVPAGTTYVTSSDSDVYALAGQQLVSVSSVDSDPYTIIQRVVQPASVFPTAAAPSQIVYVRSGRDSS